MKTLITLGLLVSGFSAFGQARFVSLICEPGRTNALEIASGETAHLISFGLAEESGTLGIERDGLRWTWQPNYASLGVVKDPIIVAGPARFTLRSSYQPGGICTFRITPDAVSPTTTEVIPPGTGGAEVELQCSTNLVDWTTALSGIYTNQPAAKFFRIRADRIMAN